MKLLDWLATKLLPSDALQFPESERPPPPDSEDWRRDARVEFARRRADRVMAQVESEIMRRGRGHDRDS